MLLDSSLPHGMVAADGKPCEFLAIVMYGEGSEAPVPAPAAAADEDDEAPSGQRLLYQDYLDAEFDEKGILSKVKFHYPDTFNFAYDVLDRLAGSLFCEKTLPGPFNAGIRLLYHPIPNLFLETRCGTSHSTLKTSLKSYGLSQVI